MTSKGTIPWNKGKKCLEETKLKISISKKGTIPWNKGLTKECNESIRKISNSKIGKKRDDATKVKMPLFKKGMIPWNKGKKISLNHRIKFSLAKTKERIFSGFRSSLNKQIRNCPEYKEWRLMVLGRDNYTCNRCGARGIYLEVHHIVSLYLLIHINKIKNLADFRSCNELWSVKNGVTLCRNCHIIVDEKRRGRQGDLFDK